MSRKCRIKLGTPFRLAFALFIFLLVVHLVTQVRGANVEWKLPDSRNNTIPDFSRVGYRQGHVQIPVVPIKEILEPSGLPDDTARIQAAIDRVGDLTLKSFGRDGIMVRGAVLLKKGVYRVKGPLVINKSGVVLRGEGPKPEETVISARGVSGSFIKIAGHTVSSAMSTVPRNRIGDPHHLIPQNEYLSMNGSSTFIREHVYIPVGAMTLPVRSTEGFRKGEKIVVERPNSQQWTNEIGMGSNPPKHDPNTPYEWNATLFTFRFERTIAEIDHSGSTITVDIPMVMNFDPKYGQGRIYHLFYNSTMISDVGVENLCLLRNMDLKSHEAKVPAVEIDNTIHGWVSDVFVGSVTGGIQSSRWSRFVTIQNCDVSGQNGFILLGQMGLVNNCNARVSGQDFTTELSACGPNVFVTSYGRTIVSTGPSGQWDMGVLYDNISSFLFELICRLNLPRRGWTGAFHVFYNCMAGSQLHRSFIESAPETTNWVIGFKGHLITRNILSAGTMINRNYTETAQPRSLYWSQLATRRGKSVAEMMAMNGPSKRKYQTLRTRLARACKRVFTN